MRLRVACSRSGLSLLDPRVNPNKPPRPDLLKGGLGRVSHPSPSSEEETREPGSTGIRRYGQLITLGYGETLHFTNNEPRAQRARWEAGMEAGKSQAKGKLPEFTRFVFFPAIWLDSVKPIDSCFQAPPHVEAIEGFVAGPRQNAVFCLEGRRVVKTVLLGV